MFSKGFDAQEFTLTAAKTFSEGAVILSYSR